jgi:hypothetical protein
MSLWKQALVPHDTDDAEHGSHGDDGADHDAQTVTMVMHGLAVLVGIYCFMFVERLLSICTRCRRRRHSDHVAPQVRDVSLEDFFLRSVKGNRLQADDTAVLINLSSVTSLMASARL